MNAPTATAQDRSSWVSTATFVLLQIIIFYSVFQLIQIHIYPDLYSFNSQMLNMAGSIVASITAILLLTRYKELLLQVSFINESLEREVQARTAELRRANEEMREEIQGRQRVQKALAQSEERFRTIIHEAAIGIAILDHRTCLNDSNLSLQMMLGYAAKELNGLELSHLIHPKEGEDVVSILKELWDGLQEKFKLELRFRRKDGTEVCGRLSGSLVRDGENTPQFVIAMIEDISAQHQAVKKILHYQNQLQSLASELGLAEEQERRRLAAVLHDYIAQNLTLAMINLKLLKKMRLPVRIGEPMANIARLLDESIQYTRSLTFELSPPILYEIGLIPALQWLAQHFQKRHGLNIQVEDDGEDKPLDVKGRVLLFQSVRELLFNIIKHAQASAATIRIRRENGEIRISVEDNGKGFNPEHLTPPSGPLQGFGLFSIRERLTFAGGSFTMRSQSWEGTKALLKLPLTH